MHSRYMLWRRLAVVKKLGQLPEGTPGVAWPILGQDAQGHIPKPGAYGSWPGPAEGQRRTGGAPGRQKRPDLSCTKEY